MGYKSHMETEALIKRRPRSFPPNVISLPSPPKSTENIGESGGRKRPWNSFLSWEDENERFIGGKGGPNCLLALQKPASNMHNRPTSTKDRQKVV